MNAKRKWLCLTSRRIFLKTKPSHHTHWQWAMDIEHIPIRKCNCLIEECCARARAHTFAETRCEVKICWKKKNLFSFALHVQITDSQLVENECDDNERHDTHTHAGYKRRREREKELKNKIKKKKKPNHAICLHMQRVLSYKQCYGDLLWAFDKNDKIKRKKRRTTRDGRLDITPYHHTIKQQAGDCVRCVKVLNGCDYPLMLCVHHRIVYVVRSNEWTKNTK